MNVVLSAEGRSCESQSFELGYFIIVSEEENLMACAQAVIEAGY
jgi:hypothetical protein